MSGIVGIYRLDGGPVDPKVLQAAHARFAHRGPHGGGCWHEGPVGLGHQLLRTTPEADLTGQPLSEGDFVLTADARLDNRSELMRALGLRRSASEVSDAQLILAAYRQWGARCPEHLIGAFAFALWDGRDRRLFCARDPMGVRPFYYSHTPGALFTCSSNIHGLLAQPSVPCRVNDTWVAFYLGRVMHDTAITAYEGIDRLPPGHVLSISPEGLATRRYWSLEEAPEQVMASDEAYVDAFAARFREAVRCRLRGPDPVGVELSGGLDSSSVASVAQEVLGRAGRPALRSYSGTFPGYEGEARERIDERPYIASVVGYARLDARNVPLHESNPWNAGRRALRATGQPLFTFNAYLMWTLMQAARADGVRVVLDGIEGDIAVSHGDGYLVELAYNGEWDRLMAVATPFADRQGFPLGAIIRQYGARVWPLQLRRGHIGRVADGLRALGPAQDMGVTRLLWRYGIKPVLPGPAQRIWNRLRGAPDQPSRLERLIAPALRSRTQFVERKQHLEAPAETITTERDAHIYTLTNGVATQFLEEGDHFAAALGVERRHPFYDVRLLEYCVGLPPDCKMRDGWTRYILRRALRDKLPSRVRRRTSKGRLRANFARNLLEMNTAAVERLISGEDAERVAPYVSIDALAEAQGRGDAEMLWAGLQLATWLRQVEEMS